MTSVLEAKGPTLTVRQRGVYHSTTYCSMPAVLLMQDCFVSTHLSTSIYCIFLGHAGKQLLLLLCEYF